MRLRVAGPAYRSQVRLEHAHCLAQIALADRADVVAFAGLHCSLLPMGRCKLLSDAMEDERADVMLSIDSDCWIAEGLIDPLLAIVESTFATVGTLADPKAALIGVCVPQDTGAINAYDADENRITSAPTMRPFPVGWIGAGICFHNLRWHRARRRELGRMWPTMAYAVMPGKEPGDYIGEDRWFSGMITEQGGHVLAIYTGGRGVFHAAAGA